MSDYKRLTKQAGWHKDIDLKDELGYSYIYQRLAELENDLESGKIVRLPCKVGDRVYVIADGIWHCQQVWQFRYDSCGLFVKTVGNYLYDFEWGKKAFLTREEAEKRILELQGETKL